MKFIKALKFVFVLSFALQVASTVVMATAPLTAQAIEDPIIYTPQVAIPNSAFEATAIPAGTYDKATGQTGSDLLAKYIQAIYNYGLAIVGILAAIILMAGGVFWLTSAGNDTKVTQAKELISGSIIGSVILFGAWMLLNTINPNLMQLKVIKTQVIFEKVGGETLCCDPIAGGKRFDLVTDQKSNTRTFASDPNKKFVTCKLAAPGFSNKAVECAGSDYSCELSWDGLSPTSTYKCVNNVDLCCACAVGPFGAPTYTSCKDHLKTKEECNNFCSTGGLIGYQTFYYPSEYNCGARQSYNWCSAPD